MLNMNEKREAFESWLHKSGLTFDLQNAENLISKGAGSIGITLHSIYNESNPVKIQFLLTELIVRRDEIDIPSIYDYQQMISVLFCYIDYLKKVPAIVDNGHSSWEKDKLKDSLTVAYYLSRLDMKAVAALGYKSFSEAFEKLSKILDQKSSTIKNMRDEFDPYFDNGRVGWYQRELRASRKEIYDMYANVSDVQLTETVREIIDKYVKPVSNLSDSNGRKRIRIKKNSMKEIKLR